MKKLDLIKNLEANKNLVLSSCKTMTDEQFFADKGDKWTNAGHIEHLINSIKPLNQLFILPKFVMTWVSGKPNRKSRTYDELVAKYWEKLATRNPTVNRFGPKKDKKYTKEQLMTSFNKHYENFSKKIDKNWNEESLENYLIPHPLLGKLTVREMIMFTVYHTLHHNKALA
jgi:hypothetical protein